MQAMEYSVIVGLAKRAEQFWGGLYTVSGAAACFRTAALRAVGGWTVATATEDIEISWRLQRAGWRLAYDPRAVFLIQAPTRLPALYRQRRRWAQGMVEVLRMHWNVASSAQPRADPDHRPGRRRRRCGWCSRPAARRAGCSRSPTGRCAADASARVLGADWYGCSCCGPSASSACRPRWRPCSTAPTSRGGWRVFPLFVIFPVYFWVVVYPSFMLGAARGMVSSGSSQWSRTERSPVRDAVTPVRSRRAATRAR